jgi:hypothetical protein
MCTPSAQTISKSQPHLCEKLFHLTFHKVVFRQCLKLSLYYNLRCLSGVMLHINWQFDDYFRGIQPRSTTDQHTENGL